MIEHKFFRKIEDTDEKNHYIFIFINSEKLGRQFWILKNNPLKIKLTVAVWDTYLIFLNHWTLS